MSTEVLAAILGRDVVESMSKHQVDAILHELDTAILRDESLMLKLSEVVASAAAATEGQSHRGADA